MPRESNIELLQSRLKAINALSGHIVDKDKVEDIAKIVARHIIELLHFEDCVIYTFDERNRELTQVAAYGPKENGEAGVKDPLILKPGQGIVGRVALSGKAEIINDLSKDPDYIVDKIVRKSELSVPIKANNKVIGVIDSESSEPNFYSQSDLDTLTTIANVISSQLNYALNLKQRNAYEERLINSEKRWHSLVENQPEGIQITDMEGRICYLNPAALRIYGINPEDKELAYGFDILKFTDEQLHPIFRQRYESLLTEGHAPPIEFGITDLKGAKKVIEVNSTLTIYEGSEAVQTIVRDITEKKTRERELAQLSTRLSTLIKSMNSGILFEDSERNILVINQLMCDYFGIPASPDDMVGTDCSGSAEQVKHLFKNPDHFLSRIEQLLSKKEPCVGEEIAMKNDRYFERDFIPVIYNGEYLGHLWQYSEITGRKKAETDMQKALDMEKRYNELNKHFISMASHEFRTPLTSISSTAEIIMDFAPKLDKEQILKRIDRIFRASQNMENLLEHTLTFGKLDSDPNRASLQPVAIKDEFLKVMHDLRRDYLSGRKISCSGLDNMEGTEALLDNHLFELILKNLVLNAHKYSPAEKEIFITLSQQDSEAILVVKDQGYGIPESQVGTIFETFTRGENVAHIKGTGLGLAITKRAVEKMNGRISLQSEVGKGTTVTICLPVEQTEEVFNVPA